jgi:hypothetical protein
VIADVNYAAPMPPFGTVLSNEEVAAAAIPALMSEAAN